MSEDEGGPPGGASPPGKQPREDATPAAVPRAPSAFARFLDHPSIRLLGVAVALGFGARALFFRVANWLWHFELPVPNNEVLPWARWAMVDRDGAEPYGLLALELLSMLATGFGFALLARARPRWRVAIAAALLVVLAIFAFMLPPRPPLRAIEPKLGRALLVVAGSLILSLLIAWSARRSRGTPATLAVLLVPICFIPTALPSLIDLACILAPALRLGYGVPPRAMYMQYDLFPSLLALAWDKISDKPFGFSFVCAATYYLMLIGLFAIARRMFSRPFLAGPLVLSIVLARMYASMVDISAIPQVTPLRLDLWPLLLVGVLAGGLRRWPVGLVLALLCFFCRSVGILYVGAYGLALAADLFARRHAAAPGAGPALGDDIRLALRETAPSLALVALSFLVARLVFGGFGSDAVAMYRHLGVGMSRIDRTSFYWWLLPMTGAVAWLAFARRGSLPPRRAEAAILTVALVVANSVYFFGRSDEHNLINTGASFLFCLFLALDLAWPAAATDPRPLRWGFQLAPYLVVAVCAYGYSQRILTKLDAQQGLVFDQRRLAGESPAYINCDEVKVAAAGDSRVFFLTGNDYWYYRKCGYKPRGYVQPIFLNVLTKSLVDEVNQLLDADFKVFVPRNSHDWVGKVMPDLLPGLANVDKTVTASFVVYRRGAAPPK
jgi:hypothetical protein